MYCIKLLVYLGGWNMGAITLLWSLLPMVALGCNFPYYMQTNRTDPPDWRGRIKAQNTEFTLQITVEGNVLRSDSTDSSVPSYTRVCLQGAGSDKFLVIHETPGQVGTKYSCVQFLKRSDNVIQFREAPLDTRMDTAICADTNLQVDDWIIIDKNHVHDDVQMCAMSGGFSIRIFDKSRHESVCDGYEGETRLESECVKGEGLVFHFRHQTCVPENVYMYAKQRTLCMANWQEGPYTFMLLKHDKLHYMWVMRFPSSLHDSFVAYVFFDLVADSTVQTTATTNYMRLDSVRDVPRTVNSLCVDDYERCSTYSTDCSVSKTALTCPRTCGLCNSTRPQQCLFENKFHGQWYNAGNPGTLALTVNNTYLTTYTETGYQERFHCILWDPPTKKNPKFTSTHMIVSEFTNGCKPRYSCISLLQKASSVLFIKITQGKAWPFTDTQNQLVNCEEFKYEPDNTLAPNMFKNDNFRLVYARTSNSVACNLPEGLTNFGASFRDGTTCSASLASNQLTNGFSVILHNCPDNHRLDTSFTCMESSHLLPSSPLLIVTRSSRDPDRIYCWVFPGRAPHKAFYLIDPGQCNEAIRRRIRLKRVKALVKFSKTRQTKEANLRPSVSIPSSTERTPVRSVTTHRLSMEDHKSVEGEEEEEAGAPHPTHPSHTNVTMADDGKVNATPFVVVAAVIFFLVFQIPCTCKS